MRRWAAREGALLAVLALAVGLLFAFTPVDVVVARLFYRPAALDHWPLAARFPWRVLYAASPWITASLLLAGVALLIAAGVRHRPDWRRQATFVVLAVVMGPGLLINLLFKDHWDRPRPRDLALFGGTLSYVAAPLRGPAGTSFPCGHCSVGFLYGLGWWLARRRHPRLAGASLGAGLIVGAALGAARMAAGGHFLSDVIWAALLAYAMAHLLYFYVLRIPLAEHADVGSAVAAAGETAALAPLRARVLPTVAIAAALAALLALFVAPHGGEIRQTIAPATLPAAPRAFDLHAARATVQIDLLPGQGPLRVSGELHGFGLPGSRLATATQFLAAPTPTLRYDIEERGWITDLSAQLRIELPVGNLRQLSVQLGQGTVRIVDATGAQVLARRRLRLNLKTGSGSVQVEESGRQQGRQQAAGSQRPSRS